jgi:hypothetical protein
MKLGNISQTIVQVPNFFVDQKTRTIEAFNLYQKTSKNNSKIKKILKLKLNSMSSKSQNSSVEKNKEKDSSILYKTSRQKKVDSFNRKSNYYRDSDLLTTFYNLNINKNPRNFTRQWIQMNQEKYLPLYYRNNYNLDFKENTKTYFPGIVDMNKPKSVAQKNLTIKCDDIENYKKFKEYQKKQDIFGFLNPNLREELQSQTKNLIDKINMNYDIKKWDKFDTRTTFNKFYQTEYSPLNSALKNTETLSEKFGKTLKLKALNLTNINLQTKKVIEKSMKSTDIENDDNLDEEQYFKTLVSNSGNNLLKLQYNNEENPKYNSRDKKFIEENKYITSKINKTKLFKEFPSKTREEFNVKKIVKYKNLKKNYKYEGNIKLKDKYENEEVTKDKLIVEDYLKTMWKRPLHKDAFKLHE